MLVGTIFPEFTEKSIDLNEQLHIDDSIQFVILTQNDTISKTYKEMTIRHKGDLDVRLGIDNGYELYESDMGVLSDNEINSLWKSCISSWKRRLLKGAWRVNTIRNTKIYNKNIKYTPLALEAYQNGVTILPYQGWIKYELGD